MIIPGAVMRGKARKVRKRKGRTDYEENSIKDERNDGNIRK